MTNDECIEFLSHLEGNNEKAEQALELAINALEDNKKLQKENADLAQRNTTLSIGYSTEGSLNAYLMKKNKYMEEGLKKIQGRLEAKVNMYNTMGMVNSADITKQALNTIYMYLPEIVEEKEEMENEKKG